MHPIFEEWVRLETRRQFLRSGASALGMATLATLGLGGGLEGIARAEDVKTRFPGMLNSPIGAAIKPDFPSKTKSVIYLHMVGGPPQMDLYDYKPEMKKFYDKDLPESVRNGQRLTTMTSGQSRFPIAPSKFKFAQYGKSGMWVTELLPWTSKMVDDMCFVRSMHTDAINHEPAITEMQTGNMVTGRPCFGSWISYGLGSLNQNLPTFVVLVAQPTNTEQVQAISARLWSAGYLPGEHAGCSFRSTGDPILYINNPPGVTSQVRRTTLDGLKALNELNYKQVGDDDTHTRIQQYELAFRMQASVPELTDIKSEPASTYALYGEEARKPGTFANTALMARRMVERGVRFVQIYLNNWDTHSNVAGRLPSQCKDVDQACYGLIQDLKARGMLDETLVIWGWRVLGGTIYSQGGLSMQNLRERSPPALLYYVDGRRWISPGNRLWGDRRLLLQYREGSRSCSRFPRNYAPNARDRSRKVYVQISGAGPKIERC